MTAIQPISIPNIKQITERERRYAVAYVEASMELARDDNDAATMAYFRAFPRAVVDERQATNLAKFLTRRPAVQELVGHLRRELSMRAMVSASRVIEELERMAFVNQADFGRIDAKGQFHVDLSRANYRQLAGLTQIEVKERIVKVSSSKVKDENGDDTDEREFETVVERTTKIKHQKMDALDKLCRVHGLFQEGVLDDATAMDVLNRHIARLERQVPAETTIEHEPQT